MIDVFVVSRPDTRVTRFVTPLKPFEAMAMGKFVVASNLPALQEIIRHEETGLLYNPDSHQNLSFEIEKCLKDSKLKLKMIENIDKPALSALWPNKKGMSVVLDLGANIECSSKNLFDFSIMGASLYTSLYPDNKPNVGLLNIGSEELKGNEII